MTVPQPQAAVGRSNEGYRRSGPYPQDSDYCRLPVSNRTGEKSRAERAFSISVIGPSVACAVLENVGFAVYREEDRALVGMRLVEGANPPPHELAGAADAVMIVERSLNHIGLLALDMLVHGQSRARLPFEEAGHL